MRFARLAVLAPLALLAACGASPQKTGGPEVASTNAGTMDFLGPNAMYGGGKPGESVDPAKLKGLSPVQIRSVLGKPIFTRRDAPAEIWQYRGRACTLDLFLYDEGGNQTVAYYAVRSPQPVNESQCMGELVSRNQGVPTS